MTLPETYRSQVQHIHLLSFKSVQRVVDRLCPLGYTVITPPGRNRKNFALYKNLNACQQQLPLDSGLIVPVPLVFILRWRT